MRKTSFAALILILFLSALPLAAFRLSDGQEKTQTARLAPRQNNILFLQARVNLPEGEAWGQHCLGITLNGTAISSLPLNKNETLYDVRVQPPQATPIRNSDGLFWLKADSDNICHNQNQPHPYCHGDEWEQANQVELSNRFFNYAFRVEAEKSSLKLGLQAKFPDYQKQHAVEVSVWELLSLPDSFFFVRSWMQAVYPWTFPAREELDKSVHLTLAGNQGGVAAFSVYNFQPFQGSVQLEMPGLPPESLILYQVKNSRVEHKLESAPKLLFMNIGETFVPELWQPLEKSLQLPVGSSTFVLRVRQDDRIKPGKYKGKVRLQNNSGEQVASLAVQLSILPFALPGHEEIPAAFGMYIMSGGGDEQEIWPNLREYGITQLMLTPWGCPIKMQLEEDTLKADFSRLNERLRFLQQFGINRKGLLFGTSEPIVSSLKKLSGQNPGEEIFDQYFQEFIRLFWQNADQHKIPFWLSLFDEANFKEEQWQQTLLLTKLAKKVPEARMWATLTELPSAAYLYENNGLYDQRDITMTHPAITLEREESETLKGSYTGEKTVAELKNRFFWEYNGVTSYPPGNNRYVFGNRAWQLKLQVLMGFTYWWGDMKKENFTPRKNFYVTYPFLDKSNASRSSTPGWEAIREGIDDYRFLHLAEKLVTQKYGATEAGQRLAPFQQSFDSPPLSSEYYQELRSQLINLIMEMR